MAVKKSEETATEQKFYRVKNTSSFVMMFPIGQAFLYPGLECVVEGSKVTDETKEFWALSGTTFEEIPTDEAKQLIKESGIFGTK